MYRVVLFCIVLVATGLVLKRPNATVDLTTHMYSGFCDGRQYQECVYPICIKDGEPVDSCHVPSHVPECDVLECYEVQWTFVHHCHLFLWRWRCANVTTHAVEDKEYSDKGYIKLVEY